MSHFAQVAVISSAADTEPTAGPPGPVFIGGLAHSGKTPLRLALAAGCEIALSRRTYMWNHFYNRYGDLSLDDNFERCLAAMMRQPAIRELCEDENDVRQIFRQGAPTYGRLFAIFHEQHALRVGKRRWGDQLGFAERYADAIFEAYPGARMIHMIRDPRDYCLISMKHSKFRNGRLGWSLAGWLQSAELAWRNQERYPGNYKVVQYETAMAQPQKTLRALCEFLGEPYRTVMAETLLAGWQDKRLERHAMALPKGGTQLGAGLSSRQLTFIQTFAQKQMQTFGYRLQPAPRAWHDRISYVLADWPANRAAMLLWNRFGAAAPKGQLSTASARARTK